MIYNNIEFHNVVELEEASNAGLFLRRIPKAVRDALSPLGRMVAQESAGCEIRFVTEAESLRLDLSSLPSTLAPWELHNQDVVIFKGAFFHSHILIEPGKINHINLTDIGGSNHQAFLGLKTEVCDTEYFNHNVWRVLLGRYPAVFHELDTYGHQVRPPKLAERPKQRILFYGSSITNGASPSLYHLCYVQQTARHLKADALNQGLSGSCKCEKEMADYLAERKDYEAICLELGVNMRQGFSLDEFQQRSRYLIEQVIARHPNKPIYLITIFPNAQTPQIALLSDESQTIQEAFNRILRELVLDLGHPNLHLIEGAALLSDYSGMSKDLIHPSDYGHTEIGSRLAARISEISKVLGKK